MRELVIVAGPNGSGKSTLASQIRFDGEFICADKCEQRILGDITDKAEREKKAILLVAKEIQASIKLGISFAFETVFATNQIPSFIKSAKENGYTIVLHYIATENTDINISRVAKRVSEGGHDVPKDKIIERYEKTLAILPSLVEFVDKAIIYDNSMEKFRPFLVKENGQIKITDASPQWAKQILSLF